MTNKETGKKKLFQCFAKVITGTFYQSDNIAQTRK